MPERVQEAYDAIPSSSSEMESTFASMRRAVQEWSVHILTAVVLLLVGSVVWFMLGFVIPFRRDFTEFQANQHEAKVRGCVLIVEGTGEYLPPSCLDGDVLNEYARDLLDYLPTTGSQGAKREALCEALLANGVRDSDC